MGAREALRRGDKITKHRADTLYQLCADDMAEDCYFDKTGAIVRFGKSKQHSP
jgi:hypothetical protein